MISLAKWLILTSLQKLPKNVGDLGELIGAKGFKKLPKVQKIAQSGHTGNYYGKFFVIGLNFIVVNCQINKVSVWSLGNIPSDTVVPNYGYFPS